MDTGKVYSLAIFDRNVVDIARFFLQLKGAREIQIRDLHNLEVFIKE